MNLTENRLKRLQEVVSNRQPDWTIVLENVHDPHNIGAVLRTCDSVGLSEIYVIYTEPELQKRGLSTGHKSASGAKKWIDIHYYRDLESCMSKVRARYSNLFGTVMVEDSKSLYSLDLTGPCALLFGNEHLGLSEEAQKHIDINFNIPQVGFVKSLNISVACAVSLYEGYRQRLLSGKYGGDFGGRKVDRELMERYAVIHENAKMPPEIRRKRSGYSPES